MVGVFFNKKNVAIQNDFHILSSNLVYTSLRLYENNLNQLSDFFSFVYDIMHNKKSMLLVWGLFLCSWIANHHTRNTEKDIIDVLHTEQWIASFYGTPWDGFIGKRMANGKRMNPNAMSAAHRTRPIWTLVRVIEHDTQTPQSDTVVVTIKDRWPWTKNAQWSYTRTIDLSAGAFDKISDRTKWHTEVILEVLKRGNDNK